MYSYLKFISKLQAQLIFLQRRGKNNTIISSQNFCADQTLKMLGDISLIHVYQCFMMIIDMLIDFFLFPKLMMVQPRMKFTFCTFFDDRSIVYYLSVAAACFLVLIITLALIRFVLFSLIWLLTAGKHHLWILPNLTEDVGFFASFWPLYHVIKIFCLLIKYLLQII